MILFLIFLGVENVRTNLLKLEDGLFDFLLGIGDDAVAVEQFFRGLGVEVKGPRDLDDRVAHHYYLQEYAPASCETLEVGDQPHIAADFEHDQQGQH